MMDAAIMPMVLLAVADGHGVCRIVVAVVAIVKAVITAPVALGRAPTALRTYLRMAHLPRSSLSPPHARSIRSGGRVLSMTRFRAHVVLA
jgi:hypothetical protein